MTDTLRHRVKDEFREPLRSNIGFVGRSPELARLVDIFTNRSAATLLVAGHRGVGKTALVGEALKLSVKKKKRKKKQFVARMTVSHVYAHEKDEQLRDRVLRALSRALYFEIKDADLDEDRRTEARELYAKTYLTELEESKLVSNLVTSERRIEREIQPD